MDPHEYPMTTAVASHEGNLRALYALSGGDTDGIDPSEIEALGIGSENCEDQAREALDTYALDISTNILLTITLAVGGPTQLMSARIERDGNGWERVGRVTYFDSWAQPHETELDDDSPLVMLFDEHVELTAVN